MSGATKRRRPSEAEREQRRAAEREQMSAAIASLQTSEGWQRWLASRRHFHSYSLHNQLLIATQRPEATRVAGFRAWLALGYCVRKGETALRIWAPLSPSKKAVEEWKRAGSDPGNAPKTRFRLVPVFDRSQVEPLPDSPNGPAPLDPPHEPIAGDALAPLLDQLSEFGASIGSAVVFEPVAGTAQGYLEPTSGKIVIDTDPAQSANARVATLVHELAHALVRADRRDEDPQLDYHSEEVVVECVSFCVCASLGLDTAGYAAPYMASWGGEDAADQVEAYARLIDRLAGRIEDAVLSGNQSSTSTEPKSIAGGGNK